MKIQGQAAFITVLNIDIVVMLQCHAVDYFTRKLTAQPIMPSDTVYLLPTMTDTIFVPLSYGTYYFKV